MVPQTDTSFIFNAHNDTYFIFNAHNDTYFMFNAHNDGGHTDTQKKACDMKKYDMSLKVTLNNSPILLSLGRRLNNILFPCLVGCSKGHYMPEGDTECYECPRGSYQAEDTAVVCTPCPVGMSTVSTASRNITQCM